MGHDEQQTQKSAFWKHPAVILSAIVLVSALIKAVNIGYNSLWIDEIYTLMVANTHMPPDTLRFAVQPAAYYQYYTSWQPMQWGALVEMLKINVHMPLYYLLVNPWMGWFGTGEVGLRSFSALMTCLTLFPLYALGNAIGGKRLGLLAAFVAAVNPVQIYFAQEGRMYALAIFWAVMAALGLWKVLYGERPGRWIIFYTFSVAGGVLTHYTFVFYLAFHAVFALSEIVRFPRKRHWLFMLPAIVLADIALWWAPVYLAQRQGVEDEYHFAKGLLDWPRYLEVFVWQPLLMAAGGNKPVRAFYMPLTVALVAGYFLMAFRRHRPMDRRREGFLLAWMSAPLAAQVAYDLINHMHTATIDRYALLMAPSVYLLMALGLERLWHSRWRNRLAVPALAAMLALAVAVVMAPSPFRDEHNKDRDNRDRMQELALRHRPSDLLLVNGPFGAPLLASYYLARQAPRYPVLFWTQRHQGRDYPLPDEALLAGIRRVWLFQYRATDERGRQEIENYLKARFQCGQVRHWFVCTR